MGRKKNRKKESKGWGGTAKFAAIMAAVFVAAFLYLCLYNRCETIGARIKGLEEKKAELRKRVMNEQYKWSNMKSPRNIEALLKRHNLAMGWPQETQIVRLRFQPALVENNKIAARSEPAHAGVAND